MMLLGFAGLGFAGYRQRQKLAALASAAASKPVANSRRAPVGASGLTGYLAPAGMGPGHLLFPIHCSGLPNISARLNWVRRTRRRLRRVGQAAK